MKLKNKALKAFGVALAAIMSFSTLLFAACGDDESAYVIPESKLPTEELFALKKYDYENLSDVQTTVRSDVRNVLRRNLPRAQTTTMSDNFSLVYDTATKTLTTDYGQLVTSSDKVKTATIHFDKYPTPNLKGYGMKNSEFTETTGAGTGYGTSGANDYSGGTMNGVSVAGDAKFYQYMLLTQGQHLAAEAKRLSAEGKLTQEWLKKHPAADAQYGAVLGENNAVEKEITLDPLYRSHHTTGLYLPAGELVTVKVEGLKEGEYISAVYGVADSAAWRGGADAGVFNSLTGGKVTADDYDVTSYFTKADVLVAHNKLGNVSVHNHIAKSIAGARLPWLRGEFVFAKNGEYKIGSAFGGLLAMNMGNCYSRAKVTFTGAVETPHYVLGQTTPEYFDEYLRNAPGVIAALDTENGQLMGPTGEMGTTGYMRSVKTDEIDKLAMLWHSFLSVNESFTGGTYNRFNKIMFDWLVPAGAAVALGNYSFAQPTGWFSDATNYRKLLSSGTWGTLHEIGHNHGSAYGSVWGFGAGREGEVRNNALTLLAYIMLCDVGTTVRNGGGAEHGAYANPYNVLSQTLTFKGKTGDFDDGTYDYFACLGMYANIMHSFGAEKFYELLYTYKENAAYVSATESDAALKKRADFAYRCALVYGMDFRKYFNTFYCANIRDGFFSEEQLAKMSALPKYEPVASYYAGGIDGVKTAGDYIVSFGEDVTFDLSGRTISSLDTEEAKGFEIVDVSDPEHGSIRASDDGKWIYSFDKDYSGVFDNFTFTVRLSDGTVHKLSVTLRISYNGARLTAYNNVQGNNFDEILADVAGKQPDAVVATSTPNIAAYKTANGQKDVRISEFYWQAPVSGEISVSAASDDWVKVYMGDSFDSLDEVLSITQYTNAYKDLGATKTVEKGKFYAVKIFNVNTGGGGSASVAIKSGDGNYAQLNAQDVFHPAFPLGQQVQQYVYEPQFLVSQKNNIKLSVSGTDKKDWKVIKAPENIHGGIGYDEETGKEVAGGGHYSKTIMYALPPEAYDADGNEIAGWTGERVEQAVYTDMWGYLIDGQAGTVLHTSYNGEYNSRYPNCEKISAENPHEFIVDTSKSQQFNFFSVTTRDNANSYITDFELQISDSPDGGWKTVATGDRTNYVKNVIELKFPEVRGRYLRLLVKGTSGGENRFSVLAEIDAGIKSETQQVVPPTSNKLFTTDGWVNSSTIADEPNGYLISRKNNQKLVIRFKGESIAVYGVTDTGCGTADVYIDGEKYTSIDLNSETRDYRKLIFDAENLSDKEHTVEIITTSADKVMLSVIGIPYSASLINAPDIYTQRALTIALVVFVLLFAATMAFVLALVFAPKFRGFIFGNRFMKKLDERGKKSEKQAEEYEDDYYEEETSPKTKGKGRGKNKTSKK